MPNSFSGEPNGGTGENCVNMWGPSAGYNRVPGKWNDWKCGYSHPCVCKTADENYPNGDGWLETDQSCVWWTKIYMEEL